MRNKTVYAIVAIFLIQAFSTSLAVMPNQSDSDLFFLESSDTSARNNSSGGGNNSGNNTSGNNTGGGNTAGGNNTGCGYDLNYTYVSAYAPYMITENQTIMTQLYLNCEVYNTNMLLNYWIYDTNNYTIYSGNQSWTSTSYNSNYTWSVPGLSIGNYTFHAELYANGTFVDSDSDGIMVIANNSGGGNTTGGGNNSSTNGDAHCLTLDNLTISSTYYVSIDLVNICNTSINYPGINASADHSGVSGFYNQTNWWYVIGANDSYTLNAQLAFDSLIQDGTNITLNFNTWILNCGTNNSWHDCPNSSDFGNMSLQFTYVNTTTNTNICGTDPSLTDLFVSIDNSDWTSIPSIVEGNYYVNCTVIGTHYWLEATIWSGSVNTSYFSTSWQENDTYESISEYWLNLSAGTHCVNVTLWDITGGSQNYVDNEYPCFTLASSSGNNTGGNNTGGNTGGNNSMGGNNSGGNTGGSNSTTLDPCGLNSSYTVLMSWSDAQTYNYGEDQNMSFYVNCTRIGESYTLEYFVYDITAPSLSLIHI